MGDQEDAFEVLRRANPVPEGHAEGDGFVPDEVLHRVRAGIQRPPVRRRRLMTAAGAAVAALAAVGWTVLGPLGEPSKPLTVGCYAAADLDSRVEIAAQGQGAPEEVCAVLWRRGVFGRGEVPPLVACVLGSGAVGVFPGTGPQTCVAVQASVLRDGPGTGEADPTALRQSLVDALGAEGCVGVPRAVELVGRALADGGYRGWKVEAAGEAGPDRPCATLAFDVPRARVVVVPGPQAR